MIANAVGETHDPRKPQVYKPAVNRDAYYAFHGLVDGERARELVAGSERAASRESDGSGAATDSRTTTVDVDPGEAERNNADPDKTV